ncbi:MAG: hypothetical protein IPG99_05930 [Ignavibacteria bacterium]|nr:hypothetical protein [Ignavibacteria bacterium]
MPDAIKATIDLWKQSAGNLSIHSSYNLAGISFDPAQISAEIKKSIRNFRSPTSPTSGRRSQIHGRKQLMILLPGMIGAGAMSMILQNDKDHAEGDQEETLICLIVGVTE